MTFQELQIEASKLGINGEIATDDNGQIIIYTGLEFNPVSGGDLVPFDGDCEDEETW